MTPPVTATATDFPSTTLLLLATAVLTWRLLALWWFPYRTHRHCKGTGRHRSGRYWRPCRGCKGTGRRLRFGRRVWNRAHGKETAR